MPVLLAVSGPQAGTRFAFDRETIVGRSSECHLRVRDGRTSRRHARFLITEGKTSVEDLGSRNGTFLNGRRIPAKALLEPGDRVRIGETVLVFEPNVDFLPARHTGGAVVLDDAAPIARSRLEVPGIGEPGFQGDPGQGCDPGSLAIRLAGRLAPQWDAAGVLTAGLSEIAAVLRADRGAVLLSEPGVRSVATGALVGGEEIVVDRALIRRVLDSSDALLFESDARELHLGLDQPISTGARVVMVAPITGATVPAGVLVLERRRDSDVELPWGDEALSAARTAGALLGTVLERAAATHRLAAKNDFLLRGGSPGDPHLVGDGPRLRALLDEARTIARTDKPVLIVGEPGAGRALLARYLHEHSLRSEGPLRLLQCGRALEMDMESLLAGEERDPEIAAGRTGAIESAHGGALYLEDVERLSDEALLLLRTVRRNGMVVRIGGGRPVPVDVRFLASTTTSAAGKARAQALLGAGAVVVRVPPLRERVDDISLLFAHFAEQAAAAMAKEAPVVLSPQGRRAAEAYDWPGNVRELKNLVERLTIIEPAGAAIGPRQIPRRGGPHSVAITAGTMAEQIALLEEALISHALEEEGRKVKVAERLGISRPTLDRKMAIYGIRSTGRGE